MRIVQDIYIKPTPEEAVEAIQYLNKLLPEYKHCVCSGKVGDWRMLPNGETCFYCPAIRLPDKVRGYE